MKLIDQWKQAYKWFSVHCMTLAGAIQGAWMALPEDFRTETKILVPSLTVALMVMGIVGRVVDQGEKE